MVRPEDFLLDPDELDIDVKRCLWDCGDCEDCESCENKGTLCPERLFGFSAFIDGEYHEPDEVMDIIALSISEPDPDSELCTVGRTLMIRILGRMFQELKAKEDLEEYLFYNAKKRDPGPG